MYHEAIVACGLDLSNLEYGPFNAEINGRIHNDV
jgi:hypothetical protein